MRTLLILTLKDLRRRLAEPGALVLNLAIPLVLAGTIFLAFGRLGGGDRDQVPRLKLIVVNLDEGFLTRALVGGTPPPEVARYLEIRQAKSREEGQSRLRSEKAAAMLVIPKGFGEELLGGRRVELDLVKNPSQSILPVVAQQGAEVLALYLSIAVRLLGDDAARVRDLLRGRGWEESGGIGALVGGIRGRVSGVAGLFFPPLVSVGTEKRQGSGGGFSPMSWMYPGIVVMGLMFTGLLQMRDLLQEARAGTLRRQLVAPVSPGQVLLSKMLAVALVVLLALLLLLAGGRLAFGVRWGAPGPLLSASALLVLAVTGFAAFLFALVKTERQGDAFGGILVMVMSLVGGTFVPAEILPAWLRGVARFTLNYPGQEAFRALATGGGWDRIGTHLTTLAALGVAFTVLGILLLRRRHLRGSL